MFVDHPKHPNPTQQLFLIFGLGDLGISFTLGLSFVSERTFWHDISVESQEIMLYISELTSRLVLKFVLTRVDRHENVIIVLMIHLNWIVQTCVMRDESNAVMLTQCVWFFCGVKRIQLVRTCSPSPKSVFSKFKYFWVKLYYTGSHTTLFPLFHSVVAMTQSQWFRCKQYCLFEMENCWQFEQFSDSVFSKDALLSHIRERKHTGIPLNPCLVGRRVVPTARWTSKAHRVTSETQQRHCARSSVTNVLSLEENSPRFLLLSEPLKTDVNKNVVTERSLN